MNEYELKIQALRESISKAAVEAADEISNLRVQVTLLSTKLNKAIEELKLKEEELNVQKEKGSGKTKPKDNKAD